MKVLKPNNCKIDGHVFRAGADKPCDCEVHPNLESSLIPLVDKMQDMVSRVHEIVTKTPELKKERIRAEKTTLRKTWVRKPINGTA